MTAKPLLPQQTVTMKGDAPSRDLVEVIQRIVEDVGASATAESVTALDARIDALETVASVDTGGTAPRYAARAWVNFNGTGTVAIRDSENVSSITDNGVGDYTVNFTTAMPDVNYAVAVGVANGAIDNWTCSPISRATGSVQVRVANGSNVNSDASFVSVVIFR